MSHKPLAAVLGIAAAALLTLAAPAMARDRNHDRIPDRWERAHHLSLRVNQARRDQDHDGLRNRAEFRAHTDPRKADMDGDGIKDGAEHAGKVASFTGGVLTIDLFGGKTLTGTVDDTTEIECADAHASDAGDQGDDHGDDPGDDHGEDPGDDDGGDAATSCDMSALTAGAVVKEAELHTVGGDAVFEKVELAG
jgi:thrombospondin type 3 repeat protein